MNGQVDVVAMLAAGRSIGHVLWALDAERRAAAQRKAGLVNG
jgi:hypothetical protein